MNTCDVLFAGFPWKSCPWKSFPWKTLPGVAPSLVIFCRVLGDTRNITSPTTRSCSIGSVAKSADIRIPSSATGVDLEPWLEHTIASSSALSIAEVVLFLLVGVALNATNNQQAIQCSAVRSGLQAVLDSIHSSTEPEWNGIVICLMSDMPCLW